MTAKLLALKIVEFCGFLYNLVCPIPKQSEFDDYIGASISTCLELHKSLPADEHFLIFLTGQEQSLSKRLFFIYFDIPSNIGHIW